MYIHDQWKGEKPISEGKSKKGMVHSEQTNQTENLEGISSL